IKELASRVAMIGDWDNDKLAVNESTFSIEIQNLNEDKKNLNAGASIKDGSLLPVLTAFMVAEQTLKNIKQSVAFSLLYNVLAMTLASGALLKFGLGAINPGLCIALMIVQSVILFYNAYRLK